jgi:ankyrin repeat protein
MELKGYMSRIKTELSEELGLALIDAIKARQIDTALELIKAGAYVDICNEDNSSALHFASYLGQIVVVSELLKLGANFKAKDSINGAQPLYYACKSGHLEVVETLVRYGADPGDLDNYSGAPIHTASFNNHLKIIEFLIKQNVDLNILNKVKESALYIASYLGHTEIVTTLLKHGANFKVINICGQTPLHIACKHGYPLIAFILGEAGANPYALDDYGDTPVSIALKSKNPKLRELARIIEEKPLESAVKDGSVVLDSESLEENTLCNAIKSGEIDLSLSLIMSGFNTNLLDENNISALYYACSLGNLKLVQALLSAGANPNIGKKNNNITPLHIATFKGHANIVKELLYKTTADPNIIDDLGNTPLKIASENNNLYIIELLISRGAKREDLKSQDYKSVVSSSHSLKSEENKLPHTDNVATEDDDISESSAASTEEYIPQVSNELCFAIENGDLDLAFGLIASGCDLNKLDIHKTSALHYASTLGNSELVKALLDAGADPNIKDLDVNGTPIHAASYNGHLGVVKILLEYRADANSKDKHGRTPLQHASEYGHKDIVEHLLKSGADPNILDGFNIAAPIHYAAKNGHLDVVKILLYYRADKNLEDKNGNTAKYFSDDKGHAEISNYLSFYDDHTGLLGDTPE